MKSFLQMFSIGFMLVFFLSSMTQAQSSVWTSSSQADDEKFWLGKYRFDDTGINATGSRSYVIVHQLKIKRENEIQVAYYRAFEGGSASELPPFEMVFSVQPKGDAIMLSFNRCLNKDNIGCESYKKGNLMLKLVKSIVGKKRKPAILTYWYKLGQPEDVNRNRIYFEKVQEFTF